MAVKIIVVAAVLFLAAAVASAQQQVKLDPAKVVKTVKGKKYCTRGWECPKASPYCCNLTITDFFQPYQFELLFPKKNDPLAHANGFWEYQSFIVASTLFQNLGFATTGSNRTLQMLELCAFLGHVAAKTSCGGAVDDGGPLAWGLCYNHEMSPSQDYCADEYKLVYPCAPGASYYGRGAIPLFWNFNYGRIADGIGIDLLNHPEYLEQNATVAWIAAMHMWMFPVEKGLPSPHDTFVGNFKPSKNDTLEYRLPGFGSTMNLLYGELVCGQGDADGMNKIISHYLEFCDLLGVGREKAGPHEALTCAQSKLFKPRSGKASS